MHKIALKALLATTLSLAAISAATPAMAQGLNDRGVASDRYGYALHNGKRDPFTDGARVNDQRDPFTDGARVNDQRDPFTDGANRATGLEVAGMDRSGVSETPSHRGARASTAA
ncbi:conserved hypothetical protein; putative exported protein [Cupriavidus taiwanensis]|uniref:hypothetical protein n=1 Tax=Cupriavidus taiwanensis TaxID=164546 RepID=UPI000E148F93|nr:hypothetical protein [Cupriavidus taiwanensis]SOZ00915.1 conserved hypothetical protein; putative exported protein [Cupriavidus taiwanensis]SOZ06653.1 conserved hypothetical protein; putative exported protein [Cupriavidus taiwanensis]